MTTEEAEKRYTDIATIAGDDEAAHAERDRFWHDVLSAIACGEPNYIALAEIALRTDGIAFSRWCS